MAWLRIDDGFAQHPKVVRLSPKDRWTWLEILCYCARYRTKGVVPAAISQVVRGASESFLENCHTLGLIDSGGGGENRVHDWDAYNPKDPTSAERQARYRNAHRNGEVTEDVTEESRSRNADVPRGHARAVPSRPLPPPPPNPVTAIENFVQGHGWDAEATGEPEILEEFDRIQRKTGPLPPGESDRLLDLWRDTRAERIRGKGAA